MNRREALKRTALLLGVAAHPAAITRALAQAARTDSGRYLTTGQFATVSAMADRILPATDTPGALDADVPLFVDTIYGRFMHDDEATSFAQGLENVNRASRSALGAPFAQLTPDQADAQLQALIERETERGFWRQLRALVLQGFFTSEVGAKQVLNYDPVPGRYDPDMPVSEVNNIAWAEG
ncbi:gluconate 2-dehydrogenase subunit 3 family protein [Synoicihabitans lomoniglobus]|uniref:Gluconate 2-dehydrogenase subunit 3 family protein n=1 Tax=Synoicihabitans lomoniglobus TaxID=2909285 RepID=A0AAE9ZWP1_9BACT|nr:gluconate 2-dehydrogenase subunit 3 family protein [Opitutaceae bacterium LMO-M01]WED64469.1 gluconate 2-dehydrogenase subunit 3 family protein [Opitutaceae bacterium LMO-M01]